ncbi:DUF2007 domain-containing protein [Rhodoligotrophos defluvii]|uniref:putative signal transducing protein n=1 Tax=Rhodoligotrophos defluvii TaxID=2561934 RepID=UPI0010C9A819|nr:DUF2007 domain-containing protein [Rhodoligotrophos defluvii]
MREVLKSNDMVALSYATALLRDAGITHVIFDANMSVVEGSLGILPRRLMVDDDEADAAVALLADAGLVR